MPRKKPTYTLHLPASWWSKQPVHDLSSRVRRLREEFPFCELQMQGRSTLPVISNDPHYRDNSYCQDDVALFGDVFGLHFLDRLFQQQPQEFANELFTWPNLELNYEVIESIECADLFRGKHISELSNNILHTKFIRKQPWGWINVPGCLQVAWYMRGDKYGLELHKDSGNAIRALSKAVELVKASYSYSYQLFSPLVDCRLFHVPHCYLPLLSKKGLDTVLPFEQEIADFIRDELHLPYRVHLCSTPTKAVEDFLRKLGPISELEICSASFIEWHQSSNFAENTVELLENDFFNKPMHMIEKRANLLKAKQMDVVIYEMDEPVNSNKIQTFLDVLSVR